MPSVRLIKHEAVANCGSYEIRFPDGRPSRFVPGRRLRPDMVDSAVAERVAKIFAWAEQRRLNLVQSSAEAALTLARATTSARASSALLRSAMAT